MTPVAGMLLIASPRLLDPNFLQSVVYLVDHGISGTLGFIVNRPLDMPLSELWGEAPQVLASARIAANGGPVDRHKGLLLHRNADVPGSQAMTDGVFSGGDLIALAERYAGGCDATGPRLFLGHSGWEPGQLLAEIEEGAWLLRHGQPDILIDPRPAATLWEQLVEGRAGGMPDPSPN